MKGLLLGLPLFVLVLSLACSSSLADRLRHGDITNLHPSGKSNGGVGASYESASRDLEDVLMYESCFNRAADTYGIQASLIAAIASRESRAGRLLRRSNGYGDNGNGFGIMQCDRSSGLDCTSCAWDSCCHIHMMVGRLLVPYIERVASRFPGWASEKHIQGGVAAYNFGLSNVRTWGRLDVGTTNNDYSNDVIARAQFYNDFVGLGEQEDWTMTTAF